MSQNPLVIAVVDDEPQMRKALRRLLVTHGYDVRDYALAAELLATLPDSPPDCLLLDLHMPEVSGFEVLERFALQQNTPPVVVITGHDEPGTAERVILLGATALLRKPVDAASLLCAIETATGVVRRPGDSSLRAIPAQTK